jgi:hypothetical protein
MTVPAISDTVTRDMVRQWLVHKQACFELGIPQSTYVHRKLKGTTAVVTGTKNRVYVGGGPKVDISVENAATFLVWCVHQPFIRGEQRADDEAYGIQATQIKQGQFAAIDDIGDVIPVTEDDLLLDGVQIAWRITNPVVSPDIAFWTCILERFR